VQRAYVGIHHRCSLKCFDWYVGEFAWREVSNRGRRSFYAYFAIEELKTGLRANSLAAIPAGHLLESTAKHDAYACFGRSDLVELATIIHWKEERGLSPCISWGGRMKLEQKVF
jgi:hypothetical protein